MPEVRTFHFNDAQTKRDGTSSHLCIHCWNWDYSFSSSGKCGRIVNFLFGLISFWEGQYWTWEWACPCWWWPCPSARPWRRCCRCRWCSPCWCTGWIPPCLARWSPGDTWRSSPPACRAGSSVALLPKSCRQGFFKSNIKEYFSFSDSKTFHIRGQHFS